MSLPLNDLPRLVDISMAVCRHFHDAIMLDPQSPIWKSKLIEFWQFLAAGPLQILPQTAPRIETKAEALAAVQSLEDLLSRRATEMIRQSDEWKDMRGRGDLTIAGIAKVTPPNFGKLLEPPLESNPYPPQIVPHDPQAGPASAVTYALELLACAGSLSRGILDAKLYGSQSALGETTVFRSFMLKLTIFPLWNCIPGGRFLLDRWGGEILRALGNQRFEVAELHFASACHAIQWIAESELAEAWEVMWRANLPATINEKIFAVELPMTTWNEEHWCNALPALAEHFSARGDRWGFLERAAYWETGLRRELDICRQLARSVPSKANEAPAIEERTKQILVSSENAQRSVSAVAERQTEKVEPSDGAATTPSEYLFSWAEVLGAVGQQNNRENQLRVRTLNERYKGPILMPSQGGRPKVNKTKLLEWWNHLEILWESEGAGRDKEASTAGRYAYGKTEEVIPEIGGHTKKRRRTKD